MRAAACALDMLQAMNRFDSLKTPAGNPLPLALKAGVAGGQVRRFRVGNPLIQYIDVLAGSTLGRVAAAEQQASQGELVVDALTLTRLGNKLEIAAPDESNRTAQLGRSAGGAVVTKLKVQVKRSPWPTYGRFEQMLAGEWRLTERQMRPWLLPPVYTRLRSGQGRFFG